MKKLLLLILIALALMSFSNSGTIITDEEKAGILKMREEEKMAHDVYIFLNEKWGMPVFENISNAESRHFSAIGFLIETYNLEDPAKSEPGKFQNQKITQFYNSMVQQGSQSLANALKVGAFIEETDIADLQNLILKSSDDRIKGVYQNLLRASENHLRAFSYQLKQRNEEYQPTVLNADDYMKIVAITQANGGNYCMMPNKNCVNLKKNNPVENRRRSKSRARSQRICN